ncbi:MAG: formylglycine-generating enzyme family protein [Saprospiraceae bacterium]|nr:formylglycine-generating enzyme family protein [Saprospiraceae bacterium]
MKDTYFIIIVFFMSLSRPDLVANNIQISNVSLTNDSTLSFNISWDNSWRISNAAPYNHDAVWIFIKRKDCALGQWSHVNIDTNVLTHTVGAPLEVYIDGKDGSVAKGLFLRRSSDGVGNVSNTAVSIRMSALPVGEFDFRVLGIEMVQIPQDSFQVGDGNTSTGSFKDGNSSNPLWITSEGAISAGSAPGSIYTAVSTYRPVALPAAYPKGYAEIYCMKYEISQGQYVDFVNLLTSDQGAARQSKGSTTYRTNISGTWPVLIANTPHRAMNYLAWTDFLAYMDWAALRPMTELEFEKICRGPGAPVAGEYAWGSSIITDAGPTVQNDGSPTEGVSNTITAGGGIANYGSGSLSSVVRGPLRCGFAANAGTTRLEAGAGYYGVMELTGNVYERAITTRHTAGSGFTGNLGDGELSVAPSAGYANQSSWPNQQASISSNSSVSGSALRGGGWNASASYHRVSDRSYSYYQSGQRGLNIGGRGVR